MTTFKAQVSVQNQGSGHMVWITEQARDVIDARCLIEAKYGRIVQGPIAETNKPGNFYDNW